MISAVCPKCKHAAKAPEEYVGRTIKCPSCKVPYRLSPNTSPIPAPSPPPPPPISGRMDGGDDFEQLIANDTTQPPIRTAKWSVARRPKSMDDTGPRYPNLQRYLRWSKAAAILVTMILGLCGLLVSVFGVIAFAHDEVTFDLVIAASGLFVMFLAYVTYVLSMAFVEMVNVLIDIESNTRQTASRMLE